MLAQGPVLLVVAVSGGWRPRWSKKHTAASYALNEAQVQAFETKPAPDRRQFRHDVLHKILIELPMRNTNVSSSFRRLGAVCGLKGLV